MFFTVSRVPIISEMHNTYLLNVDHKAVLSCEKEFAVGSFALFEGTYSMLVVFTL